MQRAARKFCNFSCVEPQVKISVCDWNEYIVLIPLTFWSLPVVWRFALVSGWPSSFVPSPCLGEGSCWSLLLNRGAVSCLFQVNSRISDSVGAVNGNWNRSLQFENILLWTLKKSTSSIFHGWVLKINLHRNQIVMLPN
jgi:hypothetical protein